MATYGERNDRKIKNGIGDLRITLNWITAASTICAAFCAGMWAHTRSHAHTHTHTHTHTNITYFLYQRKNALTNSVQFSSAQFSHSVVSNSLWAHGLQHARLPCSSPTPGAYSNSCPSSRWCHPAISSSAILFSSHLQSFPASGSFLRSQFFPSGGQSTGASASSSVLPMNIQD